MSKYIPKIIVPVAEALEILTTLVLVVSKVHVPVNPLQPVDYALESLRFISLTVTFIALSKNIVP